MPVNYSTAAKNRAADGLVQPIQATTGTLELWAGATKVASFPTVQFGSAASGVVTANAITPVEALADGTVDTWKLLDNASAEIANGVAGQRYKILTIDRADDWVTVSGDQTAVFTARADVTLHNKALTTDNVYLPLSNVAPVYDAISDTTTIYFHADLNSAELSAKTWTHIHLGELGLDNAVVRADQTIQIDSFKLTVK